MFALLTDDFVLRIRGYFDDKAHPVISVRLMGPNGVIEVILAIDTGFSDDICLPISAVVALGLPLSCCSRIAFKRSRTYRNV